MSKAFFVAALPRLVLEDQPSDLLLGGAGVRTQAVNPKGVLLDDFVVAKSPRAIHVLNARSPAATASLAIGEHIAEMAMEECGLA